jgi:hypothetical protein
VADRGVKVRMSVRESARARCVQNRYTQKKERKNRGTGVAE